MPDFVAKSCNCLCTSIKTTCLLGPDSQGNYATVEVSQSFADNCRKETCTCSTHSDYTDVARERLFSAGKVNTFDGGTAEAVANTPVTPPSDSSSGNTEESTNGQENSSNESPSGGNSNASNSNETTNSNPAEGSPQEG